MMMAVKSFVAAVNSPGYYAESPYNWIDCNEAYRSIEEIRETFQTGWYEENDNRPAHTSIDNGIALFFEFASCSKEKQK